jgi:hypothetical protein
MSGTKCPFCGLKECAIQRVKGATAYVCGTVCGDEPPKQGVMCMKVCKLESDLAEALDALESFERGQFDPYEIVGLDKDENPINAEGAARGVARAILEKHGRL